MKKNILVITLMAVLIAFAGNAQRQRSHSTKKAGSKVEKPQKQNNSQGNKTLQRQNLIQQAVDNMVFVEGGTLTLGDTFLPVEVINYTSDLPHQVTVSSYYISKYEVTQALWLAVMGNNPSDNQGDLNRPVECVSWDDCQIFINKLNQLTGKKFRLPTEAEWEFAARGGNLTHGYKYAGSNNIDDVAWHKGNARDSRWYLRTFPVGKKAPNELGLYDMSGNVEEWCQDYDWGYQFPAGPLVNPTGPETGVRRVHRGGSYVEGDGGCTVFYRYSNDPDFDNTFLGLRLAI